MSGVWAPRQREALPRSSNGLTQAYAQNRCTQTIVYLFFIRMFLSFGFYERRKTRNKRLQISCLLPRLVQARYRHSITGMFAVSLVLLYSIFEYYLTSIEGLTFNCQFVAMSSSYTKGRTFDCDIDLFFHLLNEACLWFHKLHETNRTKANIMVPRSFPRAPLYHTHIYSLLIRDLLLSIVFILILSEAATKIPSQYSLTHSLS